MPGVRIPLPTLRQADARPTAHMRHTGTMPRGTHESTGSTATRVPIGMSQSGPASTTRPGDLVAEQERERPEAAERGRAQRPVAEHVQIAPADAADGHRDARPLAVRQRADRRPRSSSAPKSGSFRLNSTARTSREAS